MVVLKIFFVAFTKLQRKGEKILEWLVGSALGSMNGREGLREGEERARERKRGGEREWCHGGVWRGKPSGWRKWRSPPSSLPPWHLCEILAGLIYSGQVAAQSHTYRQRPNTHQSSVRSRPVQLPLQNNNNNKSISGCFLFFLPVAGLQTWRLLRTHRSRRQVTFPGLQIGPVRRSTGVGIGTMRCRACWARIHCGSLAGATERNKSKIESSISITRIYFFFERTFSSLNFSSFEHLRWVNLPAQQVAVWIFSVSSQVSGTFP